MSATVLPFPSHRFSVSDLQELRLAYPEGRHRSIPRGDYFVSPHDGLIYSRARTGRYVRWSDTGNVLAIGNRLADVLGEQGAWRKASTAKSE